MKRNILKLINCTTVEPFKLKRSKVISAVIALLAVTILGAYLFRFNGVSDSAPKVSPFTEMRFEEQQIIVTYEGENYEWLELDGIKDNDIVAAAKWRFWGRWQKRVSEDLVDVLWGMDHHPGDTVSLRLRDLETNEERVVEQAPMTKDNRSSVYQYRTNNNLGANANRNSDELLGDELNGHSKRQGRGLIHYLNPQDLAALG